MSRDVAWQAIWDEGRPFRAPPKDAAGALRGLTLWLELIGPRRPNLRRRRGPRRNADTPLRLWRGTGAAEDAVALYLMADGALRLIHGEIDLTSAPETLAAGETVSIRYVACAQGREDIFEIINHDRGARQVLRSGLPKIATLAEALPSKPGYLNVAHVAAIAGSVVQATDLPGIESGAIVATAQGPRPVDALRPGDLLLDAGGAPHPLRWIEARSRLCLGRTAPICMRAPYFGLVRDLVVTPQARLLQSGPVVDYLCGTEAVLVEAADLTIGRAVVRDRSAPMRRFFHLMLDDPTCILVENCPIETAHLGDVLAAGDGRAMHHVDPDEGALVPSLPLLDRATARALVTAHARAA